MGFQNTEFPSPFPPVQGITVFKLLLDERGCFPLDFKRDLQSLSLEKLGLDTDSKIGFFSEIPHGTARWHKVPATPYPASNQEKLKTIHFYI